MIEVKVRFFATLRDRAGVPECTIRVQQGETIADLKKKLIEQYPDLEVAMPSALVALNKKYAFDHEEIPSEAEVALFPPVSGGAESPTVIRLTTQPIEFEAIIQEITLPTTGAICFFCGIVRGLTTREQTISTEHLLYEAYETMAEQKMAQVASEMRERWPGVEGIAIIQRIGMLLPGSPTVLIACSASHRDSGVFEAARYGIDRLKEIVPIWKKEVGSTGAYWVEGSYIPTKED